MTDTADGQSKSSGPGGLPVLIIAVVVLVVFGLLATWMLANADVNETIWARRVYVFGAVEAIVFAAVGWLFGREVHRSQAESAKKDADVAKDEAASAREEAAAKAEEAAVARTKGQALASAVRHAAPVRQPTPKGGPPPVSGQAPGAPAQGLRDLADELFPSS